jgi:hypothetical protein
VPVKVGLGICVSVGEVCTVRLAVGRNVEVAVGVGVLVAVELVEGVALGSAVRVKVTVDSGAPPCGSEGETRAAVGVTVAGGVVIASP